MKIRLLAAATILIGFSGVLHANKAVIHNQTPYLLQAREWHTWGWCFVKKNIPIPPNQITEIRWKGDCPSTRSIWDLTLDRKVISNILTIDDLTYYPGYAKEKDTRHWYVTAEPLVSYVADPMNPGRSLEITKFVRFTIKIEPAGTLIGLRGGTYIGKWINIIDHRLATDAEIKAENLPTK